METNQLEKYAQLTRVIFRFLVYVPLHIIFALKDLFVFSLLVFLALIGRFRTKSKIGIGPEPLINNVYHKKALMTAGYRAETFVTHVYFITEDFDVRFDTLPRFLQPIVAYGHIVLNYSCLYFYFNGGPLGNTKFKNIEPLLFKLAIVKTVVMPYGSDVCDLTRTKNFLYRNAMSKDYPFFEKSERNRIVEQIDRWEKHADHVISGCDWVEYMYHWDTLMLGHFSIDLESIKPSCPKQYPKRFSSERPLKLLHAPNHRNIKGTKYFESAVERLKEEGCAIELHIVQKVPNSVVRQAIEDSDVVLDQLIIGWYAMFAIEAMALERPVICHLEDRFRRLYESEGLIEPGEIPIIDATFDTVYSKLRDIYNGVIDVTAISKRGRGYLSKHHSVQYIGHVFSEINESIGISKPEVE